MSGQLMDTALVPAPWQRNNDGEKAEIKAGKTAQEIWPDKPARARQKNVDANWTLKVSKAVKPRIDGAMLPTLAVPFFRYKNHVSTDRRHGLIRKWAVTSASDNNGARLPDLLDKANTASDVWATRPTAQRRMRRCWRSIENAVQDIAAIFPPRAKPLRRQKRRNNRPFFICQIKSAHDTLRP